MKFKARLVKCAYVHLNNARMFHIATHICFVLNQYLLGCFGLWSTRNILWEHVLVVILSLNSLSERSMKTYFRIKMCLFESGFTGGLVLLLYFITELEPIWNICVTQRIASQSSFMKCSPTLHLFLTGHSNIVTVCKFSLEVFSSFVHLAKTGKYIIFGWYFLA